MNRLNEKVYQAGKMLGEKTDKSWQFSIQISPVIMTAGRYNGILSM
jgi:hypothetical protein